MIAELGAFGAGVGLYWAWPGRIDPSGPRHFANGNAWMVTRDREVHRVEEFRSDTGDLWARGEGTVQGRGFAFRLDLVRSDPYRSRGARCPGRTLSGQVTEVSSGEAVLFSVDRAP